MSSLIEMVCESWTLEVRIGGSGGGGGELSKETCRTEGLPPTHRFFKCCCDALKCRTDIVLFLFWDAKYAAVLSLRKH